MLHFNTLLQYVSNYHRICREIITLIFFFQVYHVLKLSIIALKHIWLYKQAWTMDMMSVKRFLKLAFELCYLQMNMTSLEVSAPEQIRTANVYLSWNDSWDQVLVWDEQL